MAEYVSIIVPVLDDEAILASALAQLQALRAMGHEVIVSDGGSRDGTLTIARPLSDIVLTTSRSRASRLNGGAYAAKHNILLFLLPYIALPAGATDAICRALASPQRHWGGFALRLWDAPMLSLWRSYQPMLNHIYRLDQGLFVRRSLFQDIGGFAEQPILEDAEINLRLQKIATPVHLRLRMHMLTTQDCWADYRRDRALMRAWRKGMNPYDIMRHFNLPPD
jgi:glycosyltransferase involved in cell wall biosynthesis